MIRLGLVTALTAVLAASIAGIAAGGGNGSGTRVHVLLLEVKSEAVGQKLPLRIVIPPGDGPHPLVVFLHGRGQTPDALLDSAFFDAYEKLGTRAPIVAMPYGGDHSYWHNRADGAKWRRWVISEALPKAIAETGADRSRIGIAGISMGGFGALDIAEARPARFCLAAGHSPALWRSSGESAPGAFDDAADFARHDVIKRASRLAGVQVWLDAGQADPFLVGDRAFAGAVVGETVHYWSGGHTGEYWDSHWADYLGFYARALRHCG